MVQAGSHERRAWFQRGRRCPRRFSTLEEAPAQRPRAPIRIVRSRLDLTSICLPVVGGPEEHTG
jgi:hypothetical protein